MDIVRYEMWEAEVTDPPQGRRGREAIKAGRDLPVRLDHRGFGGRPARQALLVVFDNDLAATHFLRVAAEEMVQTRTALSLLVSQGPAGAGGAAWTGMAQAGRGMGAGVSVAVDWRNPVQHG